MFWIANRNILLTKSRILPWTVLHYCLHQYITVSIPKGPSGCGDCYFPRQVHVNVWEKLEREIIMSTLLQCSSNLACFFSPFLLNWFRSPFLFYLVFHNSTYIFQQMTMILTNIDILDWVYKTSKWQSENPDSCPYKYICTYYIYINRHALYKLLL